MSTHSFIIHRVGVNPASKTTPKHIDISSQHTQNFLPTMHNVRWKGKVICRAFRVHVKNHSILGVLLVISEWSLSECLRNRAGLIPRSLHFLPEVQLDASNTSSDFKLIIFVCEQRSFFSSFCRFLHSRRFKLGNQRFSEPELLAQSRCAKLNWKSSFFVLSCFSNHSSFCFCKRGHFCLDLESSIEASCFLVQLSVDTKYRDQQPAPTSPHFSKFWLKKKRSNNWTRIVIMSALHFRL